MLNSDAHKATTPRGGLLDRNAVLDDLNAAAGTRLRLLTGPAGAGKSVLAGQLAAAGGPRHLLVRCTHPARTGLVRALAPLIDSQARDIEGLLTDLGRDDRPTTVVVDDAHALHTTPDLGDLNRLLTEAPDHVRFVVTIRDARPLDLSDVPGSVHRLGYQQLRFTAQDVALLFDTVYHAPVPDPEALCEQVEGLPVALRHLHLDTVRMSGAERNAVLRDPVNGSERLREFLTRAVLGVLPGDLRDFMVDVSPLGRLSGRLCDALLGAEDSEERLTELAAREALTFHVGLTEFRFHALLRGLLELQLAERRGPHLTRQTYQTAVALLTDAGKLTDAYRCAARAEDWVTAARLAHEYGLPTTGLDDPWVVLAEARRLRAAGHFAEAHARYAEAAARLPEGPLRWQCEHERIAASHSMRDQPDAGVPVASDVVGHLTEALREHPARMVALAVPSASPEWVLARAVAAMVDGRIDMAVELAEPLAGAPSPFASLAARLLTTAIRTAVYGSGTVAQFYALAGEAEAEGWLWLARIARATTAVLEPSACADAAAALAEFEAAGDDWGCLIAILVLLIGQLRAGQPRDPGVLRRTLVRLRRMRAPLLEMWLRALVGPEIERMEAGDPALAATAPARPWAKDMLGHNCPAIVAVLSTPPAATHRSGLTLASPPERTPPVAVRCFVTFEVDVHGEPVPLDGLRAQARRVLRVLAVHYGQPIHEERLAAVLWPDTAVKPAKRRLQVAISSLRALFRTYLPGDRHGGVVRHGSAYLLRLPAGSTVDVVEFAAAMREWRRGQHLRDPHHVREVGTKVLDLYRGELLAEEGSAEWLLARRESLRGEAMGVAVALAGMELDTGDPAAAAAVCERALAIDDLDHRLWTVLADARARLGDGDGASRAHDAYRALLAEG
ncbi:BTAD domain-containing putative transcriptional regulator [Actinophytocola algeriensis]|uniref:DNA-binding SARP family transcriptional activator n=1 Tax=Actinophytocola algeriensis TaxID=1768010 RepID=A0A7W7Q4S1_9PSEU|nr:BTAD domain-containing putative transcriptional regulator [Actinophytocola algeriensis]MBB4907045.1 DNA-binding SARP family transcriptional activator [Actinophytocola algeriensis]MBE1478528.1 DNA-binding SARP family transcriptional activator [Actinophytocola algeriensis]